MKRNWYIVAAMLITVCTFAPSSSAQQAQARPRSSGLFVGLDMEADGVNTHVAQGGIWTRELGGGGGLLLGYGFTPRWSLYSELSDAAIEQTGGGTYSLEHLDVGARIHFRAGANVVPFAQFGFSGRRMIQHFPAYPGTSTTLSRSGGVGFGAGVNIHFNPAFAISGSATWTAGNFEVYKVNNDRAAGVNWYAMSGRVHLGMVWFPGA